VRRAKTTAKTTATRKRAATPAVPT
jgi:hypothetical protein